MGCRERRLWERERACWEVGRPCDGGKGREAGKGRRREGRERGC